MQRCLRLPLFVALVFCCSTSLLNAQNVMNPNDTLIDYVASASAGSAQNPVIPPDGILSKWIRTPYYGAQVDQFKSYIWNGMAFRIRFPNNYNPANASKYPAVVFFHGKGESHNQWDNENQLFWGALVFEERMNKGDWNGFILFPQENFDFGEWGETYFNRINSVLDTLQKYNNSDPDRVISVGVSSGGFASLYYSGLYGHRVAASISCSTVRIEGLMPLLASAKYLPTWIESGGLDPAATPASVFTYNKAFRAAGGNLYSTFYQTSGHYLTNAGLVIWSEQWNMKNKDGGFITSDYFNKSHKAQPVVLHQNDQICIAGGTISTTLGISPGYYAYEWQMNKSTIAGAAANEYTATQPGTYRARFKRMADGNWSAWSPNPIVIASPNCATDTLFAEHFNIEPDYSAPDPYAFGNYACQNGMLTNSTETFTQDATNSLGGGFLAHFTYAASSCIYSAGAKVWGTTKAIAVKPNTNYQFIFYLANQSAASPAKIAATVNGNVLPGDFVSASGIGNPSWTKYFFTWNSGNASNANLGLINNNSADSAGNDFALDEISFRPVPPPAPTCVTNIAPAGKAVVAYGTNVLLSWNAALNAASYDIYLTSDSIPFPDTALANVSTTTYNAVGLKGGLQYKFYVVPRNASGAAVGCGSNATTFTVAAMPPAPSCVVNTLPANASILPSQTSVRLTWPASAGATSYDVYLAAGNAVPTVVKTNSTALTYYVTGLTAGTLYSWYIAPGNANGANTACGAANKTTFTTGSATGGANLPPVAGGGTNITVTLPVTTATLNGTASFDPDGSITEYYWYQVQGPVTATLGNFTATPTVTGLTTAGTYIFGLQVKDNNGVNAYSGVTVVVNPAGTQTVPACVTNTSPAAGTTMVTQNTATLTWPSSATATSYDVYLAAGTGTPATLVTNTSALSCNASGLTAGTTYSWYVAPRNASGANSGCAISSPTTFITAAGIATLSACVTNTLPVNGSVLPSQTSARLSWLASADAASYDVYLAAGNAVPTLLRTNSTALTYYATNLTAGTLYSWYIAPGNANGANTACGATNKTTFTTAAATGGANQQPVANGGTNIIIALPVSTTTLNGTASYDPDGSIIEYYWYQVQGPVTANFNNFTATPSVTGLTTAGTYIFGLQVKDNSGVNAYSGVTVTVKAAGAALREAADARGLSGTTADGIYPNPVAPGQNLNLVINSEKGGMATIQILSSTGNIIHIEKLTIRAGMNTKTIHTAQLAQGLYIIHMLGDLNKESNLKLLVE